MEWTVIGLVFAWVAAGFAAVTQEHLLWRDGGDFGDDLFLATTLVLLGPLSLAVIVLSNGFRRPYPSWTRVSSAPNTGVTLVPKEGGPDRIIVRDVILRNIAIEEVVAETDLEMYEATTDHHEFRVLIKPGCKELILENVFAANGSARYRINVAWPTYRSLTWLNFSVLLSAVLFWGVAIGMLIKA